MANTENIPIDKLSSKEETTNYCRIILLIVDVGTETLLHLFYSLVPKNTVKGYFAAKKSEIENGKKKKIFDKSQYAKLTCPDPNPDNFDISLLIKLINYFNLSSVKLDSLQTIRNEIVGHNCRAELIAKDFKSLWVEVENILFNIAKCVSGDEEQVTKLKVTELKEKVLEVSDREKKIIKTFEAWYKEEIAVLHEKIQSIYDQVKGDQHLQSKPNAESAEGCKILKMLQRDCISYYRKVLSKLQLSPLVEEDDYAANFFDVYVKPNITILSHQELKGQSKSTSVTFHDIFSSKPCQNIYISSPAGCGKTSFAKYLALIWCQAHQPIVSDSQWLLEEDVNEMRTFMFLFILFLRDSHESECDTDIMIQNQLLPNLSNNITYAELGVKFLQNLLSNVKCIIILDGLDEWSHLQGNTCMMKNKHIPHSRARPLCTTLTTSRPWKLDIVRFKPGEIDQKLEINGLNDDLFKRLIKNVVTKMNKVHGKEMQAYHFEQKLRAKKLTDLSKLSVVVMQLLTVWFDNEPLGESQCEIYSNMIEFLLKRFCKEREIVPEMEDMEVDDCSRDRQIPKCLQNNIYCTIHMELLSNLAKLAYNTLFTDNEETSLVFDRRIAKKYLTDKEIEMSLAIGILTQDRVLGKMSKRQSHVSFIHKTFQEYLAALYVALISGMETHVEEKIKHVCCSIEKIMEMSQIFMFLSGLCPEVMVNFHEHLRQTVSEDSGTQRYRASWGLEWWSSDGQTLRRVQDTMMEWLGDCWLNGHKHVTHLPVSDIFIFSPRQWSAELKSQVVHSPVCTLYVRDYFYRPEMIEDILNSVTVSNFIQKLWLESVSETFVSQLVCQHKHSLSVRPEIWRHLEWVTLDWMYGMSGEILCSLVDSILKLPKSVQVRLLNCSIKQRTRDWKAYLRLHPRLTMDNDDVEESWSKLLQFHTNKPFPFIPISQSINQSQ